MSIAASTVPVDLQSQDGEILRFPITTTESIYKGDMVRIVAAGTATSATVPVAADMFVGVAMYDEVYDATKSQPQYIKVQTSGVFSFLKTTPAQTDVGCLAYDAIAANQQTVLVAAGAGTGSGIIIGAVVRIDPEATATRVLVKIQPGLSCGVA